MEVQRLIEALNLIKDKTMKVRCYTDEGSVDIDHGTIVKVCINRNDDGVVSLMLEDE